MEDIGLKKMGYLVLTVVLVSLLLFSLMAGISLQTGAVDNKNVRSNDQSSNIVKGKELFFTGREMFYNAEAEIVEIKNTLKASKDYFSQLEDGFEKYYWQAQVEFVLAEIAEATEKKREAAQSFYASSNLIKKGLEYEPKSSDAHRLLADTYMRLTNYNGTMYMISHGPQALELLNKAISLDKENYTAFNSLATYYINAPAIGGGSVDKGIKVLQKALESEDKFDNFISYVWLGIAYAKKKKINDAVKNLNKALEIYPNSPWAKGIFKKIKG